MRILESPESPKFRRHFITLSGSNLHILEHTAPDFSNLSIFLPLFQTLGQELQTIVLFAKKATETLFNTGLVSIFTLLMHSLNLSVSKAVLFH